MALSKADFNNINVTPAASKKLKWNSAADGFEAGDLGGSMVLLSTQTASSSATIDFTSGIDSTYKEYIFKFINIHPASNGQRFTFQADTGTNTNYNQTMTTTHFQAEHSEGGTSDFRYRTDYDQAQGTSFQAITQQVGNDNDECFSGSLTIFEPSSSVFVKHFMSRNQEYESSNYSQDVYTSGYINTTTPITRIRFKFESGNIDAGTIKMYGIL